MEFVTLLGLLIFSITASVFFSAAETSYVAVSRYKIKNPSKRNRYLANLANKLLDNPDELLSFILLGNNLANVGMTTLVAVLTIRYFGEGSVLLASLLTTFFILIVCEITPKSIAYRYSYPLTLGFAWILYPLRVLLNPIVSLLNRFVGLLKKVIFLGKEMKNEPINIAELKGAVVDARTLLPGPQRDMLLNILDFHSARVEEAMTALGNVEACDLSQPLDIVEQTLLSSSHSHLLAFRENINEPLGFLEVGKSLAILKQTQTDEEKLQLLLHLVEKVPFVPATVNLLNQLEAFSQASAHRALVVDEYGMLQGIITLKDIVPQITGVLESSSLYELGAGIWRATDKIPLRILNNRLGWDLHAGQAKTLRGLILEKLEELPEAPVCVSLNGVKISVNDSPPSAKGERMVTIWKTKEAANKKETEKEDNF